MIPKQLQSSHPSSFGVNLTDIFKVIAKYRRIVISKYCKVFIYCIVGTHYHVDNNLRLFDV